MLKKKYSDIRGFINTRHYYYSAFAVVACKLNGDTRPNSSRPILKTFLVKNSLIVHSLMVANEIQITISFPFYVILLDLIHLRNSYRTSSVCVAP